MVINYDMLVTWMLRRSNGYLEEMEDLINVDSFWFYFSDLSEVFVIKSSNCICSPITSLIFHCKNMHENETKMHYSYQTNFMELNGCWNSLFANLFLFS